MEIVEKDGAPILEAGSLRELMAKFSSYVARSSDPAIRSAAQDVRVLQLRVNRAASYESGGPFTRAFLGFVMRKESEQAMLGASGKGN